MQIKVQEQYFYSCSTFLTFNMLFLFYFQMFAESYVPFYKQKTKYPEKLAPVPPVKPPIKNPIIKTEGYDNQGTF